MFEFDGLWWLLLSLGPLFLIQRTLQKELQEFLLLLTRRVDVSLGIFSLLFFPGVFLHEISHYLMAKLLRVRTGNFSLIPQNLGDGRLRLGYVETEEIDFLRDAFIGFAPLLSGMFFVGATGKTKLGLITLWEALNTNNAANVFESMAVIIGQPNYWVWFYAAFAISSTMMPSASDRRALIPLLLAVCLIIIVSLILGFGPTLLDSVVLPVNNVFKAMALAFAFSSVIQLVVLLPISLGKMIISKITGLEIR